jgi:peptide/nickel transport system substrate-binding protein
MRPLLVIAGLCAVLAGAPALAQTKDTLSIDIPGEPATIDPHVQWDTDSYGVYRNIFDNLVTRDVSGKIVPQIATAWKYADDNTIDFTIRTDVKFHDGSPLTSADVAFSINRIIDPAFKSPQLDQFNSISKAEATAPDTVRVTTKAPYPALLAQLVKLSIVPKAYVEKVGNEKFNLEPIGSGPYKFVSWQKGVRVTLAGNETYWRGKPQFKTVVFNDVPDVATRIADLKTGRADLIRQLNPDDTLQIKDDPKLKILSVPTERIAYLYFNTLASPSKDIRVRKAMAMGIDSKLIISSLLGGYGKPVDIMAVPAIFGYVDDIKGYPYDPAAAKALVKEAGAEGAELVFLTSPAYDQRIVQAIQQMLGDIGLKVTIATSDQRTFLQRRQGTPENAGSMAFGRWSCACQDVDGVILPLFKSDSIWAKYNNPEFDKVVVAARETLDSQARLKDYHRAFEIIKNDLPGIGLYQDVAIYAARKELQWTPTANEAFFVYEMKWQ